MIYITLHHMDISCVGQILPHPSLECLSSSQYFNECTLHRVCSFNWESHFLKMFGT